MRNVFSFYKIRNDFWNAGNLPKGEISKILVDCKDDIDIPESMKVDVELEATTSGAEISQIL